MSNSFKNNAIYNKRWITDNYICMKIMINRFLIVFLFLFSAVFNLQAGPGTPCPGGNCPPTGPGVPIDDNIIVLLVIGFLFGIRAIYKHRLKTKASV